MPALDQACEGFRTLAHKIALGIQPDLFSKSQQKTTLEQIGIRLDNLNNEEVEALYGELPLLLKELPRSRRSKERRQVRWISARCWWRT